MDMRQSIAEIEQQLKSLKKQGLKNKIAKAEYSQIKRALNKLYSENKHTVMQFEKTNYEHLVLVRSTNNFYKLFGHSALFYAHSIAPKLNLKANLQTDGDFATKSDVGFISIREPEKLTEALTTIGIKKVKTNDQTGNFLLYKLPWTFTENEVAEFIEDNHFKMRSFNHVVLVDNIIPVLFIQLEELLKAIYENVRGMGGPVERETFGYDAIRIANEMVHSYLDLANGKTDKLTCLKKLKIKLSFLKYQTKIITDLKIWQPKVCARIGDIIIKVQEIIDRESHN